MNHQPFVSIIIPTYNRSSLISITLDSLLAQTYPSDKYEIVVVDNHSTDETATIVKDYEQRTEGRVRYFYEGRQGSHYARNNVVKHVRGELLYFTDDDMITDAHALEELVRVMVEHPEVGTATGRVLPKWQEQPTEWLLHYFVNGMLSLFDMDEELYVGDTDCGIFSCHQMVRKDLFVQAGGYNPDIVDGEWLGDNETGLCIKIKKLGAKFAFTHKSETLHIIPPRRMTQEYFNKRFANQGNCDSYTNYRQCRFSDKELLRQNRQFAMKWVKKLARLVAHKVLGRDKWHVDRAYLDYYRNRIRYNNRIINDPQWREMVLIDNWIDKE